MKWVELVLNELEKKERSKTRTAENPSMVSGKIPLWERDFPNLKYEVSMGIRLSNELHEKVKREADRQGVKSSVLIRRTLEEKFNNS